jgi:hypothetical protein
MPVPMQRMKVRSINLFKKLMQQAYATVVLDDATTAINNSSDNRGNRRIPQALTMMMTIKAACDDVMVLSVDVYSSEREPR